MVGESNQQDHHIDSFILKVTIPMGGAITLLILKVLQSLRLLEKIIFDGLAFTFGGLATELGIQYSHFVIKFDLHSTPILIECLQVVINSFRNS